MYICGYCNRTKRVKDYYIHVCSYCGSEEYRIKTKEGIKEGEE